MINTVTITIKDTEQGSVDIQFNSDNDDLTPAVTVAKDLYKLMKDYVESFEDEEITTED